MKYVIDRYNIVCKNNTEERMLSDVTEYSETVDFAYLISTTKDMEMKRGWRGDIMVDYVLMDTKDHNKITTTEYHWDDVILIKIEPTSDRNWKYTFAKK